MIWSRRDPCGRPTLRTFPARLAGTRRRGRPHAILAVGLSRSWTTDYRLLERGRWSWPAVWRALLGVLTTLFTPSVWHVVLDDTVVERISARAPGSLIYHNHTRKPNRPPYRRGQGWLCLAAVVERNWKAGAVPLMLRLVRRGTNRGKLKSVRFLLRRLGHRLGRVRVLLDAWFRRGDLIRRAAADGHTVIGRVRRDLALYEVPKAPRWPRRGRRRKYGERMTRARVEALPVHRTAQILYGHLEVVRYRTALVAARFLTGAVVRAVWVDLERPDHRNKPREQRLLLCTDPALCAIEVIHSYARRWAVEPLFAAMKHGWGLTDAWQRTRQGPMRWVPLLAAGYALSQMLAYTDPARIPGLADPAPWRPPETQTAGLIQAGVARILRVVGMPTLTAAITAKIGSQTPGQGPPPGAAQAA